VGEVVAKPMPHTAGAEVSEFKCVLMMADTKMCFKSVGVGDIDVDTITFDEFVICLVLCGNFKYSNVKNGGPKDEGMDVAVCTACGGALLRVLWREDSSAGYHRCALPTPRSL
jgi:hypothetical protein